MKFGMSQKYKRAEANVTSPAHTTEYVQAHLSQFHPRFKCWPCVNSSLTPLIQIVGPNILHIVQYMRMFTICSLTLSVECALVILRESNLIGLHFSSVFDLSVELKCTTQYTNTVHSICRVHDTVKFYTLSVEYFSQLNSQSNSALSVYLSLLNVL